MYITHLQISLYACIPVQLQEQLSKSAVELFNQEESL